tara:strand:- start:723 stop:1757 length:1035 start_codon:yes stop_codon:yes gene_type:complete
LKISEDTKLDFSDVLIKPKRSNVSSRSQVSLNRIFRFPHSSRTLDCIPIMAANMDTTGSIQMSDTLTLMDCMTSLHKHYASNILTAFFRSYNPYTFYSTGISEHDIEKLGIIYDKLQKKPNLCIDVANGYNQKFVDVIKKIRNWYPEIIIMAGNVVTPEMTEELIFHGGVDIVKIGIGSGSVCTTRLKTGIGYPQLSAVIECADAAHSVGGHVCSDGGCTTPADICKAFCANADFVMLGGMLAGTDCCSGNWQYNSNKEKQSLQFYGMSSKQAMNKHSGGVASYRTSEGKCVTIPYKGKTLETVQDILGGLRSCCTYIGARTLKDMGKNTTFIKVNNTHNKVYS